MDLQITQTDFTNGFADFTNQMAMMTLTRNTVKKTQISTLFYDWHGIIYEFLL